MKAKFKDSIALAKSLVHEQMLPLFGLFLISVCLNITVEDAMHLATPAQETQQRIMQVTAGVWELIEGVLMMLILSWAVPKVHKFKANDLLQNPFETPYLGSFFAEYLRLLAQVMMWALLLLVPGFVRYAQLIFVPYVALFAKSYREGKVDALRLSEKLVHGRLLKIIGIWIGTMVLQGALEYTPQMIPELHNIPFRVVFSALGFLISVWTYSLMFVLFESYLAEEK